MKASDVVVIGAGIMGSSTAYYLAKAGFRVTLIDRQTPLAGGSATQACAGGVRQQGRAPAEIPLAIYSINLWAGLEAELGEDLEYHQDGMTVVTDDENQVPVLVERITREQSLGLDIRLVRDAALHGLIPGLSAKMLAGSYCPTDGHANPMRTVNAFIAAAQRLGVRAQWCCGAEGLVVENHRLVAVKTAAGDLACGHAVLAAGYWSLALAAALGLNLPFRAHALQMMVTARRPRLLDQVLAWVGHGISLKQMPSGGFVIGGGWPGYGDSAAYQTRLMPGSMAKSAGTTLGLFPALAGMPVIRAWVGIEAFGADGMQVIGPVPGVSGLILAAGFSGHGFAIGPGVGALIADYLITGKWPPMLAPFTLERFGTDTSWK